MGVLETKPIGRNQQALQEEEKKKLLLDREANHQLWEELHSLRDKRKMKGDRQKEKK